MNKKPRNRKGIARSKVFLILAAVAFLALSLWGLDRADVVNLPFLSDDEVVQDTSRDSGINYGPPTEQEKKETEQFKEGQESSGNAISPPPPGGQKRSVTPTLTSWGQNLTTKDLEGAGYVSSIVESSGTCTLTATKGSQQVSESRNATQNAQNVSCGLITIARSKLSVGSWSLTLSYSSPTAEGTSQPQTQEVK